MAWYFVCSEGTLEECFERKLFGDAERKNVKKGDTLFLFDYNNGKTYGPFTAETDIEKNLVPSAWNGNFPWQVRASWQDLYRIENEKLPYVDFDKEILQPKAGLTGIFF